MKHVTMTFALILAFALPVAAFASPPPATPPAPGAAETPAHAVHRAKMHRTARVGTAPATRQHAAVPAARTHARATQPATSPATHN